MEPHTWALPPRSAPLCVCGRVPAEWGAPTTGPSHTLHLPALGCSSESAPLTAGCRVSKEGVGPWWTLSTGPVWGRRGPRQAAPLIFRPEEWLAGHPISEPHLLCLHCSLAEPDRQTGLRPPQCHPQLCLWIPLTAPKGTECPRWEEPLLASGSTPHNQHEAWGSVGRTCVLMGGAHSTPLLPVLVLVERR